MVALAVIERVSGAHVVARADARVAVLSFPDGVERAVAATDRDVGGLDRLDASVARSKCSGDCRSPRRPFKKSRSASIPLNPSPLRTPRR